MLIKTCPHFVSPLAACRWTQSLLDILSQVSQGPLESLCLEQWHNSEEWQDVLGHELTFDMSCFKQLKRMALTRMGPCQLLLPPQACHLYICSHLFTWPQPAAAITSLRLVMEVFVPPYTDRTAEMLRELPVLTGLRELELALKFCDPMAVLRLPPALFSPLTKLTSLRVYPTWRTGECKGGPGGIVALMVPAALKLRTLHIVAPTVRLGFQDARATVAALRDFKMTAAVFESLQMHTEERHGITHMLDELGPHLAPGLSVRTCPIDDLISREGEAGIEASCVWINENELRGEMLQDYLLDDPCQCRACWSCLRRDRKLLASAPP